MSSHSENRAVEIRQLMQTFIDERLAGKLEKLASDDPKREALVEQFEFEAWVGDAARRVSRLQVVTHALKATHPAAKGSSRYVEPAALPDMPLVGSCKAPDDRLSHRSYPLLAARDLIAQFIQEQRDGYQTA
ncbi:hypothetical protein FGL86_02945 [Pistricoccus aurantiacus]|uniref:Uncharacterized protein n=2 Tax=Pistricoccus aurantiacus TaxID=1883414 RepID=A0A5B8SXJ3_9GAMM|nr:hypothetical protein FGL86_02945 [Pistricoccus aurantiacus]